MNTRVLFTSLLLSFTLGVANSQSYEVPKEVHNAAKNFTEFFYNGQYEECLEKFDLNRKEVGYVLHDVKATIQTCQQEGFCDKIKEFQYVPLKSNLEVAGEVEVYDIYFQRSEEFYTTITLLHKDGNVEIGWVDTVPSSSKKRISELK